MMSQHCCPFLDPARCPKLSRNLLALIRLRSRFGLLGAALTCLAFGCAGKQPPPPENKPPAPVELMTTREMIFGEWTELLGATQPMPNHVGRIAAAVEGHVLWLLRDPAAKNGQVIMEGQRVEKGQILGKLDDRIIRANREKIEASLAESKEQKNQADYAVELATIDVNRLQSLLSAMNGRDQPLISKIELEKARIALKTAESKQKEIVAKQKGLEDELKAIDDQLDLYVLRAPIAGRLGAVQAVPGQTLAIGATVAEVVDLDSIDVLCFVPPKTAARLALGQTARVVTEKEDLSAPRGKVEFIAVQAQPDTGSFAVKVRFPNPELRLRGGSVLRVEVLTKPEEARITIPESALLEDQDPPSVVIVPDLHEETNAETGKPEKVGRARKLRATIGIRDRRWHVVEILGLDDPKTKEQYPLDDQVQFITKGGRGLEGDSKEGDKVKLDEEED
jgi:RND family efflux transporter MFP subunit